MSKKPASRIALAAVLAFLALIPAILSGEAVDKPAAIEALVKAYQDAQTFNGSVLVAEGGRVIFKKGFGLANREWNVPNAPGTRFRIGSITKQFTAALVLQLAREKKIELQGKLAAYLPLYRKDVADKVTIHHLLTHTSGIPDYTDNIERLAVEAVREPYPPAEFVAKYCSGDLQFEPGSRFRYCNSGYFILGAIIEAVAGKSYEEVLKERIIEPLGMRDTGYDRPVPLLARRAAGYAVTFDGFDNARYVNMSLPYSAGAMYSTVEDLYRWDRALAGDSFFPADMKALWFKPQIPAGKEASYAYGWMVMQRVIPGSKRRTLSVSHAGGIFGFTSYIERLPDEGHLVVILCNTPEASLGSMTKGILGLLFGETPKLPKKPITRAIYGLLLEKGPAEAIAKYRDLKKTAPEAYDFNPRGLSELGYYLLKTRKMTPAALEIFRFNVAEYPKDANGYVGLAEAFLAVGDKTQAVVNYAKSLELDPENANAAAKLAEILKK